jgi:hypothetical protein
MINRRTFLASFLAAAVAPKKVFAKLLRKRQVVNDCTLQVPPGLKFVGYAIGNGAWGVDIWAEYIDMTWEFQAPATNVACEPRGRRRLQ